MNIDASQELGNDAKRVKSIYQHSSTHTSIIEQLLNARHDIHISQARGLCSRVYKIPSGLIRRNTQQDEQQLCIKRVDEDDQYAPHAVAREVLAYSIIGSASRTEGADCIMNLVAAFKDESDDFTTLYDLVMPWYPCTLQDLLDEPHFQISQTANGSSSEADEEQRPALQIAKSIIDPVAFIQKVTSQLFSALCFLHANGIAHRDVKPTNILLKTVGTNDIQLIDFGTCFLSQNRYTPGDDGKGGLASEVGTSAYRAPECLLSPLNGYDPYKVDIWQAGVTLAEFFLPLKDLNEEKEEALSEEEDNISRPDERLDWERALWSKDDGKGWTDLHERFDKIQGHSEDFFSVIDDPQPKVQKQQNQSSFTRQTLFEGSRGDLGLANSIFDILGLPNGDAQGEAEWPEAVHFQPSLSRLPFKRRLPREGGLKGYLTDFVSEEIAKPLSRVLGVLQESIRLSARSRIDAAKAVEQLSK
ncbi:kinase-like protein [Meira miltonrushii]|uniref:Kinase-like protein n=1 Tax=Meira miltonrushii TaxID=1280837 RepID=A0A316VQ40_9BASI|nr:kinase-like protein [Meira miltonrushii]PWN38533.1 kinase-like protein [Meira miltonrushii]